MDDLFGGLDNPKPVSRQSKTDFMSDLFGGSSNDSTNLKKGKEFVLDDKYKKLAEKPAKPEPVNNRLSNTVTINDRLSNTVKINNRLSNTVKI